MFSTLADEDLNTLEALFTTITLDDNQVLCKEGSRVDHVYVVKRGFLRIFKAFLPEDGQRPRPPSSARGSSRASPRHNIVKNGAESAKDCVRLMHFDLGETGPKDILGENGVFQPIERTPPAPVTSAAAPTLPTVRSNQTPKDEDSEQLLHEGRVGAGVNPDGDARGDTDAVLPSDANANAASPVPKPDEEASATTVRQSKGVFLASATASGGKAEVYVAKAYDLKRIQTESFRYSWKTAQRLHQARAQAWSAGALVQKLRREQEWGALKRETVLEALAINNGLRTGSTGSSRGLRGNYKIGL